MIGDKILVWLGAFGGPKPYRDMPGDTWVESTVLETRDDGSIRAQRDSYADHVSWIKPEHWKVLDA